MSDSVNVASLVGTWVAAAVALIALVGVVGPILVWRAIRTERYKSIDRLSQGTAETGGYVTKGLRLTPTIRVLRRFQAPDLQSTPLLPGPRLDWDGKVPLVSTTSAGWVQFGRLLESYHIRPPTTKLVEIRDGQTWLPTHKTWLLIVGIVGRYGNRKDKGRLAPNSTSGIASKQAQLGVSVHASRTASMRNAFPTFSGSAYGRASEYQSLFGVTGSLHFYTGTPSGGPHDSPLGQVYFGSHTHDEIGDLPTDALSVGRLFWLAVGCLPASSLRVYSMEDVEMIEVVEKDADVTLELETSFATLGRSKRVDSDDEDSDDEHNYRRYTSRPNVRDELNVSSTAYVVPNVTPAMSVSKRDPRAFRFSTINHRVAELVEVARSVKVDDAEQAYSLEEIRPTQDVLAQLNSAAESTYVPTSLPWVRFRAQAKKGQRWFLRREDAQLLAQALLTLPMSPLSYLVGGNRKSKCWKLLSAASRSLYHLLVRVVKSLQKLGMQDVEARQLSQLMETLYVRLEKMPRSRPLYETIYELDAALVSRLHPDPRVNDAIGVLMLTNEEFRDLITQSARHIEESITTKIELDVAKATLNVPAVMGFVQRFPVELTLLHPALSTNDGPIAIEYRQVMFAALKAAVRSTFLATSLDSLPLFRTVLEMDTIVCIGSSQ